MIDHKRAEIIARRKEELPDGSIVSIVIWLLPERTIERPHGYKYRLNYSAVDGTTLVRYDNRAGKGDHKHIGEIETAYEFESVERLVKDFYADVRAQGDRP